MATLRQAKKNLKALLAQPDWESHLQKVAAGGMSNVGALFSFLLLEPVMAHRAARALGLTVAQINKTEPEAARNIIRRFMWHMNEDSGNIGWGIPFAFGETLAASQDLAKNYGHILLSYIYDLGFADNYCDHAGLRRQCYWGIGRFAQAWPKLAEKSRPWLIKGLKDEDLICQGMAAWALGQLPPVLMEVPALAALAQAGNTSICEIFNDGVLTEIEASTIAKTVLAREQQIISGSS